MNIKQLKNEHELFGGSAHFERAKVLLYFTLQNTERHLNKRKLYNKSNKTLSPIRSVLSFSITLYNAIF